MIATATLPASAVGLTGPVPTHAFEATGAGVCYWLSLPKSRQSIGAP